MCSYKSPQTPSTEQMEEGPLFGEAVGSEGGAQAFLSEISEEDVEALRQREEALLHIEVRTLTDRFQNCIFWTFHVIWTTVLILHRGIFRTIAVFECCIAVIHGVYSPCGTVNMLIEVRHNLLKVLYWSISQRFWPLQASVFREKAVKSHWTLPALQQTATVRD